MNIIHDFKILTRPWRRKVRNFFLKYYYQSNLKEKFANTSKKRFILMHGNLGDQAIALGELKLLGEIYPQISTIEITEKMYEVFESELEQLIRVDDVLLIHGGGFFGNLYPHGHGLRRQIIKTYPNNKIVCMPTSIFYTSDSDGDNYLRTDQFLLNSHENITIMARDEKSFILAEEVFFKSHNVLVPDCAFALYGSVGIRDEKRQSIVFILRKDKERALKKDFLYRISQWLPKNTNYELIDNVCKGGFNEITRTQAVKSHIEKIARMQLVITDRFHGVIFAAITHTPVVAYGSLDTKITSGIKWLEKLDSVYLAEPDENVEKIIVKLMKGFETRDNVELISQTLKNTIKKELCVKSK